MTFQSNKKRKPANKDAAISHTQGGDIAIVGMACRFPGAADYKQFWDNLAAGINSVREITPDRWDIKQHYSPDRSAPNKSISKWGGLLDRIDHFDAPFFHISPREAQSMDPQQRMLLEEAWHCIEDAGVSLKELHENRTSVYVGVMATDYYQYVAAPDYEIDGYACLGNYEGILSNRLSYFFDLTGESQSLDAACASSLVALHNAKRSLLHGECDYAIAAGVNVICHPWKYISFSKAHMLSPEGKCKTFDAEADGYVPGEGVGVLLLESLENALKKGHHVYGILKGSTVHHNGKTKSITAPQVEAQRRVIEEAHRSGGVLPETITYIEAHGTGTSLGDPIEIEALTEAFHTPKKQFCYIGSVKTNIGHLEGAAGIAGVIKVLLMMQNRKIPKILNINTINPIIDFENSPFRLADAFIDWDLPETIPLRRAGVSSFGFGGISSHVVIEEYQAPLKPVQTSTSSVALPFLLSAQSSESLNNLLKAWQSFAATEAFKSQSLHDICYTLVRGRQTFSHRYGLIVRSKDELLQALNALQQPASYPDSQVMSAQKMLVLCLHDMASLTWSDFQESCKKFPILSQLQGEYDVVLNRLLSNDVLRALYDDNNDEFEPARHFMMQFILGKALLLSGLHPGCLMGDGEGVLVEAVLGGMLDFEVAVKRVFGMPADIRLKRPHISVYDALSKKIINRYKVTSVYCQTLMADLQIDTLAKDTIFQKSRQLMANQFTFKKLVAEWNTVLARHQLDMATILVNPAPLSKNQEQLVLIILLFCMKKLNEKWDLAAKIAIKNINAAEMVDLLLDKVVREEQAALLFLSPSETIFESVAADIQKHQHHISPQKPYRLLKKMSCEVGEIADVDEWLGKGGLLAESIHEHIKHPWYVDIGDNTPFRDSEHSLLKSRNLSHDLPVFLMDLWLNGISIDWPRWYFADIRQTIPLPVYPFDKEHYWIPDTHVEAPQMASFLHPLLDTNLSTLQAQMFSKLLSGKEFYLNDHRVQNTPVLPAAAYVEMISAAGRLASRDDAVIVLRNIIWTMPIWIAENAVLVNIAIFDTHSGSVFEVSTGDDTEKRVHAQGTIIFESPANAVKPMPLDIAHLKKRLATSVDSKVIYAHFYRVGLNYGPAFNVIEDSWRNQTESLTRIQLPQHLMDDYDEFFLHPSLLDGALQAALNLLENKNNLYLPFSISQIDILGALPAECYVYAAITPGSEEKNLPKFTIQIANAEGRILVSIRDLAAKQLRDADETAATHYYHPQWVSESANSSLSIAGVMLVFDDEGHVVQELRNQLPGHIVIHVKAGDCWQIIDNHNYQINTRQVADYTSLMSTLAEQNIMPAQILYLTQASEISTWSDALITEEIQKSLLAFFHLSQALIAQKPRDLIQLLCINERASLFTSALSGFAKTLHLEHPKLVCKIIDAANVDDILREINSEDIEVRYDKQHHRWVRQYREMVRSENPVEVLVGKSPVYLITGGAGGLGLIFARYFAERYQAKLILTGRSELNAAQKVTLASLEKLGAEVLYVRSDVSKREDVARLMMEIKERFGALNGVFHAAGVVRDSFILKKTPEEISAVLTPKINGTLYLDELTEAEPLDFFVLFSSMVSIFGNVGQSDYAFANAFMDAFAIARKKQSNRHGKTIAINWPLWAEGGMTIDDASLQWLESTFGVLPLSLADGLAAMLHALGQQEAQQIVLVGKKTKLNDMLNTKVVKITLPVVESKRSDTGNSNLKQPTLDYLKSVLSKALSLPPEKIIASYSFEKYGIDSLMILNLNGLLEQDFSDLPKTLFFEYLTLDALADYFIENHVHTLAKKIRLPEALSLNTGHQAQAPAHKQPEKSHTTSIEKTTNSGALDIAIIGLSGRYPHAADLSAFWENLKAGIDSIVEIPGDRWDYHLYFDTDKNKDGKSYSKWGGFIDDVDKFDPLFFGISPHEAELMDPQERLFLETSWKAIEDAGYTRDMLSPKQVGVFVGVMYGEYQLFGAEESVKGNVMSTNPLYAYIANRVSWFFDFHGPSIALDTMCSSSLTSVHLACQSIRNGECQLAIAGGVNISIHPNKYIFLSRGRFLASDGRCRSFGDGGDGYVPGEGIGAIVLKPLQDALADGDHIYGVIKGSRVNHGGKTNGFTVPSPTAQAALIAADFKEAQIDPVTIGYIEAHGTGTSLGDPIEISGLNKVFKRDQRELPYAIGSVKSNIGHLESAAGIAAITKVLLQMQYKTLVPSLHSETSNPNINWGMVPFKVQRELAEWTRLVIDEQEIPRRSTISSFGAGGSNAHMIIEEAPEVGTSPQHLSKPAYLITLSAKTERALQQKIMDFRQWLQAVDDVSLEDISYTLNCGRVHFDKRSVFIASSIDELRDMLSEGRYVSNSGLEIIQFDPVFDELLEKIQAELSPALGVETYRKKLTSLADLYIKNFDIDWERLHAGEARKKISLPTYPFAKERYWIQTSKELVKSNNLQTLHPLLDTNVSTFERQCFTKLFSGKEFYLTDHIIHGHHLLPGAALMEMATVAGALAAPDFRVVGLKDIVWMKPVQVEQHAKAVILSLYPEDSGAFFEVTTEEREDGKMVSVLHSEGKIIYALPDSLPEPKTLDLSIFKNRCLKKYEHADIYDHFKNIGFHYGPSMQGIRHYFCNDREAIAFIQLPEQLEAGASQFDLHPCILDSVLQTIVGLSKGIQTRYMPFSIDQIDIFAPLPKSCYACVTLLSESAVSQLVKCQIVLTDEAGTILIKISNFILRSVDVPFSVYYYRPVWQQLAQNSSRPAQLKGPILVFEDDGKITNILRNNYPEVAIFGVASANGYQILDERHYQVDKHQAGDYVALFKSLAEKGVLPTYIIHRTHSLPVTDLADCDVEAQLQENFYALFYMTQALVKQKFHDDIQLLCVNDASSLFTEALSGVLKTIHLEHPSLACRMVTVYQLEDVLSEITGEDIEVRYQMNDSRWVKRYQEIAPPRETSLQPMLKQKGVYLLSGGMGGLGLIFARYLATQYQARLVLTGRSALGDAQQVIIADLQKSGAEILYVPSDVSKRDDVERLVRETKTRFGELNGIIHSAGVVRDSFILKKTREDAAEVLSSKIYGTINLDEVTKTEPLDFFALFSSVTASFGNMGQCDYAYGNGFEDAFARQRNESSRSGKTVAINWPLWAEGGMNVDETSLQWLEKTFGIIPLSTEDGVKAFIESLAQDSEQVIVLPGHKKKLEQALLEKASILVSKQAASPVISNTTPAAHTDLKQKTDEYIRTIVSEIIKLQPSNINSKEAFENYGIDSVMIMKLNQKLEQDFGELPKTLFFEYMTPDALTDYFVQHHANTLETKFSLATPSILPSELPANTSPVASLASRRFKSMVAQKPTEMANHDIAIIGISGRYPEAGDLDAFWDNLKAGKDSVTEIPLERWDNSRFFDADKDKPGKTYGKWGGFVDDIDKFDPFFFNISVREAELMDPQERLFLETAWKTLEDAGYTRESLANKQVGVFVGAMFEQYQLFGAEELLQHDVLVTNSVASYIANRVSYYLDFHGPSITLDTMCSSSLTAIHLACDNLRLGRCQVALAGGVNLSVHPNKYILLSQGKFLASDGRCRSFGEGGDGYVPAEGVGAVLLKPLQDALDDGDHIYGVIKGSSVNHGGKTNGLTVPNPALQAALIEAALKDANVHPATISYVEAHGTGTALGDPIELAGLVKAFGNDSREAPCVIASVKSNIGHAESAAGIAALTKVLLQMQHQALVPSLHSEHLNSNINWKDIPFSVQQTFGEWRRLAINEHGVKKDIPRRAGISSFGAGGSNAHIIIEEAPEKEPLASILAKPAYLITLSAKTDEALKEKITDLHAWLERHADENLSLEDISYTLNAGRSHFEKRCALVVGSVLALQDALQTLEVDTPLPHVFIGHGDKNTHHDFAIFKKVFKQLMQELSGVAGADYQDNLLALANFYADGYDIDWERLHEGERRRRISLPTYPFFKLRCWIDTSFLPPINPPVGNAPAPVAAAVTPENNESLAQFSLHYLQHIFSDILKCPIEQLAADKTYEVFGIDSVLGIAIQKRMEADFGTLSSTLLYEKNRLQDLSDYLQTDHKTVLQALYAKATGVLMQADVETPVITATIPMPIIDADDAIAIIGISGKYPEADNLAEFWENLKTGRDCVTRVPENRWRPEDYPVEGINGHQYFDQGGFLRDVDKFDPMFFNIPPMEASLFMDPQERLFLQTAWSVIEDAGYTRAKLEKTVANNVGVFVGVSFHYYPLYIAEEWFKGNRMPLDIQMYSVANRVSYFFNFNGPSLPVDTACSSSLSAIHLACESIKRGECMMAIAGGVNLSLHPAKYYMLGSTGFMSKEGRCTSFGADGTGYVPGEGVGAVLLKSLRQARADNDHIYGVIKVSTMNHGGKTSGYSVPNPNAQAALISTALAKSGIDPQSINYIEAHGTGTSLGDPIEIKGLQSAFERYTKDRQFCAIGSVKSNIGHAEAAAGISQVTKVLLQMKHHKLVPSLHAKTLNPNINFQQTPFYVQRELSDWEAMPNAPRRAGISSFGAGGANAFLIIEDFPIVPLTVEADTTSIFVLSAQDANVLYDYAQSFHQFLSKMTDQLGGQTHAICYSVQVGREAMPVRLAFVVNNYAELVEKLARYLQQPEVFIDEGWASLRAGNLPPVVAQVLTTRDDYEQLAKQWVAGSGVHWEDYYAHGVPGLVPLLPVYPFAKRRCWVPGQDAFTDKPVSDKTVERPENIDEWLYTTRWIPQTVVATTEARNAGDIWLIFGEDQLRPLLQQKLGNKQVIQCRMGEQFIAHGTNDFVINPDSLADYEQLFAELIDKQQTKIAGIVYLWPITHTFDEHTNANKAVDHLLLLTQSLAKLSMVDYPEFWMITRGGQAVLTDDTVQIWQHPLWAFANIFAMERPDYLVKLIDLDSQLDFEAQIDWLHQCLIRKSHEGYLAFRQDSGYVLRLLHQSVPDELESCDVPEFALVSGGLGALGFDVATRLIEQGTRYLLLLGSTPLPERDAWNTVSAPKLKSRIDALLHLESKGAHVQYFAADVADKKAIAAAVETCETLWNKAIDGVFHLAGVTTDSVPVDKMTTGLLHEVLSPKVQGTLALHELFKSRPLRCFVLFSSVSAIPYSGISGLSAYATANAFLDGFAAYRRSLGLAALCVNWSAWAEKGMSVQYHQDKFLEAIGVHALPVDYGMRILAYLLSASMTNVIVQNVDWQTFMQVNANLKHMPFFEQFALSQSASVAVSAHNSGDVLAIVSNVFADMLQLQPGELDCEKPFQEYGLDSVNGIKFILDLNKAFPDTLAQTDLYRYVTITQLADYIYQQTRESVSTDTLPKAEPDEQLMNDILAMDDATVRELLEQELRELDAEGDVHD